MKKGKSEAGALAGAGGIEHLKKGPWHRGFLNRNPRFDSIFDSFLPPTHRIIVDRPRSGCKPPTHSDTSESASLYIGHPLGNEQRSRGLLEGVMSGREFKTHLLSAFALTIGNILSVALPLAVLIIWVCSRSAHQALASSLRRRAAESLRDARSHPPPRSDRQPGELARLFR